MRVALFAIVALVALTSVAAYDCTIGTHPAFGVTPADQSECTCSIAAGDYSPLASTQPNVLTVNLGASHATSTRFESQKLYIVHDEHVKWFAGVQSDNNQPNPAYCRNFFNWTTIASPVSSCHRRWVGVARWADVYQAGTNDCKLTRTTDANNIVKFTFDFSWSHKQTVKAASGSGREVLPYERTVVQKMPFDIILPTEFTITSDAQQIFAPVLLLAAITKQEVVGSVPGNVTANLQIYTSLQHPFQLVNPVATIPASIASSSAIAIDNTACATVSGVCEQRFNYALTPGANTCTFNGIYRLDFGIICRTPADECPLDAATNTAGFQFQLASSSHCAVIADTIELAGEVAVLDAALNPKVNFLDTQVVIFKLSITSAKASIQSSTIREAVLNRPWNTAAPTQALVTNFVIDSTAASTYSVQTQVGGTSAAGSAPESGSHPTLQLTVKSVPLGLAQDEIKTITVSFVVFVQYQNAGQASSTTNSFEEEAEYGSSVVSVTASAGFGGSAASTSSSTSSPKIAGVNAFAAAGAFVAIVAAVAAVVVTGARVRANRIVQRYSVVEETATSHA